MTSETPIEQRLAAAEAAIAEIQHRLDRDETDPNSELGGEIHRFVRG